MNESDALRMTISGLRIDLEEEKEKTVVYRKALEEIREYARYRCYIPSPRNMAWICKRVEDALGGDEE